jgi:hypothetical protein
VCPAQGRLPRLIGGKQKRPLPPDLTPDVRAGREHRDRRQPASHLIEVLQLADPVDRPDEDSLPRAGVPRTQRINQ